MTLAACSCVNKAWRYLFLPMLFERIVIKYPGPSHLLVFLCFLDVSPHIRGLIKELSLNPSIGSFLMNSIDMFARIISLLPSLRMLTIRRMWFTQCEPHEYTIGDSATIPGPDLLQWEHLGSVDRRPGAYPLRLLVVDGCIAGHGSLRDFHGFFNVLALFRVETLWFRGFDTSCVPDVSQWAEVESALLHRPPAVLDAENIVIGSSQTRSSACTRLVMYNLRMRLPKGHLRSLALMHATEVEINGAGPLLEQKGESLSSLSLDVSLVDQRLLADGPQLWKQLAAGLCGCINLTLLSSRIVVGSSRPSTGVLLCRALASLLSSIPASLQEVRISMQVAASAPHGAPGNLCPADLASMSDFPAVDRALSCSRFPHLERVRVRVEFDRWARRAEDCQGWLAEVGKLLRRLKADGLLVVEESRPADLDPW